jgi:hypothetical protein
VIRCYRNDMIATLRMPIASDSIRAWFTQLPSGAYVNMSGVVRDVHLATLAADGSHSPTVFHPGLFHCLTLVGVAGPGLLAAVLLQAGSTSSTLLGGYLIDAEVVRLDGSLVDTPIRSTAELGARPLAETSAPVVALSSEPRANAVVQPARPTTPIQLAASDVFPEQGDICEHFTFGRCTVMLSDGERIHLRAGTEGRTREVALSVLRVLLVSQPGEPRVFRLERKR